MFTCMFMYLFFTAEWSQWSPWSKCSATCGEGVRFRARHCLEDACVGEIFNHENCTDKECRTGKSLHNIF